MLVIVSLEQDKINDNNKKSGDLKIATFLFLPYFIPSKTAGACCVMTDAGGG